MSKLTKLIKLALVATGIAAFAADAQAAKTYTADLTGLTGTTQNNAKRLATDAENGTKIVVYVAAESSIVWGEQKWSKGKYKIYAGCRNVTRIEMTCTVKSLSGEGWSQAGFGCVWEGCVPGNLGVVVNGQFENVTKLVVTTDEPEAPEVPLIVTDNAWQTTHNPFAKPTTLPHWLSNLCYHKCWTNALGGAEGEWTHWRGVYWFTGANTKPTSNDPDAEDYFKVARTNSVPCQTYGSTDDDKTCLANIQNDATQEMGTGTDKQIGKSVEVAICKLLRSFESRKDESQKVRDKYGDNFLFLSNVCQAVNTQLRGAGLGNGVSKGLFDNVVIERIQPFGPFFSGYNFTIDASHPLAFCSVNNKRTPTDIINDSYDTWGAGLNRFLDGLKGVPTDWSGMYRLAAGTDAQAKATGEDWPMFDEDVYLDRGDVLLMRFAGHALNTACLLLKAYKIPGTSAGKRKADADPDLLSVDILGDNFKTIGFTDHRDRWQHDSSSPEIGTGYAGDEKPRITRYGYKERIERIFHDAFHVTTNLCAYIDDEQALSKARSEFKMALECFLDADAFITGEWPSATTHDYGGKRVADQLHLFEFAEAADDEDGGEWNIAGYREIARKAYASLSNKGKTESVQPIDLVQLGKALDIHAGSKGNATAEEHGVIDFSRLGKNRDGVVSVDVNPLFDGMFTKQKIMKDYQSCVTTNGTPGHWVRTRYNWETYPGGENPMSGKDKYDLICSNYVHALRLNISAKTIDTTLAGVLPDDSLANDLATMKAQFPADGEKNRSQFAQMVYPITCEREVVTGTKVLEQGKIYTAALATANGGAFDVKSGATLTGTNVVFKDNKALYGGAINNNGTVNLNGVSFEGNEAAGDGGAIFNKGTVNFDGAVILKTESDTIFNGEGRTLNWNLADGKQGFLGGYQNITNSNAGATLQLTVGDYQATTNFTIATGNFSNIATAKTDTFSITNVLGGAALPGLKIDGDLVTSADGWTGYQLVTEEDLDAVPPTTNLVLQVTKYSCVRTMLAKGGFTNLVEGIYTAVPATLDGGAFSVKKGATLTGTNVTFAANESTRSAGAIDNGGTVAVKGTTFTSNKAQEKGGAIVNSSSGLLSLDDVTFTGNEALIRGGAILNGGTVNFDGAVTLKTETDTICNEGTLNWNLKDGKNGFLDGYQNLTNKGINANLQLTVETYADATNEFVIATGDFTDVEGKDTFVITNTSGASSLATTLQIGSRAVLGATLYELALEEDLEADPPTTNLVLTAIKVDMSHVIVDSTLPGGYKPGDDIPDLPGFFYGINYFTEMPEAGLLAGTETLEIAGSAAITNTVTLKSPAKLILDEGAALSIMGDDAVLLGLGETSSIDGQGAIYLDKAVLGDLLEYYTSKLAQGCNITVARASVTDMDKGTKDGFWDVNTTDKPASTETNEVITAKLTADGAEGAGSGLALRVNNEKNLVAAGELVATVGDQTLKLVREADAAGDLTVNGKVSGFDSIVVENKNEEGKMTATSTLAANKNITILNDGHLDAKAQAGADLYIRNTTANTLIGEYSGQNVTVTNTAAGVAEDIVLQAYGTDAMPGMVTLVGEDGSVYSNVVIVAGKSKTPGDLSANDGSGFVGWIGTNTFSGTVVLPMTGFMEIGALVKFVNANAVVPSLSVPAEIAGECNISSNELGTADADIALTLKDGAVLGGNTRLNSICSDDKFALEGTVTLKDGAEFSRPGKTFTVPADATLKLQGATITANTYKQHGKLLVESGENEILISIGFDPESTMSMTLMKGSSLAIVQYYNRGVANLTGGEFIGKMLNGGLVNWDLTEGTTTLNWAKVTNSGGTFRLTVGDAATGTSYVLATNVTKNVTDTFTVTNSVSGGAAAKVKAGGICKAGSTFYALDVKDGALTLTALEAVKLSDVMIIDAEGKTNATAVVQLGGTEVGPGEGGVYDVPAGYPLVVKYKAADDQMFGPGWETKTVAIGELSGDTSMNDEPYASLKPTTEERWVEVREIALDTRERIVIGNPNEVLPIAYSTNFWGEAAGGVGVEVWVTKPDETRSTLLRVNENGYAEWMPGSEEYGKYELGQKWINSDKSEVGSTNVTIIYSSPFPLTLATAEGGSVVAITNGLEATGTFNMLGFEKVTIAAKPAEHWQLKEMVALTNDVELALENDKTSLTNKFEMPCYGTVVTGSFVIAETYRAELAQAATNSYVATTNAFNGMRLTDTELAQAIVDAKGALDSAIGVIAGATKPSEAKNAKDALDEELENIKNAAQKASDMKPFELVIASDFAANPPFADILTDDDGNVTNFTYAGRSYVPGISAYTSIYDAFTNETYGAFATNLHVFGAQMISREPPMVDTWNLDLVTYVDGEGEINAAVISVGGCNGTIVDITNNLGQITGAGEIVLSATKDEVDPSIYDDYIADGAEIGVVNTGVTPKADGKTGAISVDVDDKAKPEVTEEGKAVIVLPGLVNGDGDISLTVESTATNDVLVAGTISVPDGTVTISNSSTNELSLTRTIEAKNVVINNYGKDDDAEGSILAAEVVATGDVEINNDAHLEANVVAGGAITIFNDSPLTIVGTYKGATVSIMGGKEGAISNVTFVSDGPVKIWGVNVLTGPFEIDADAITNSGTLVWSVANDNKTATLTDFDAIVQTKDAAFEIRVDGEQATNAFCGVYTLAKNAATATGKSFTITGPNGFDKTVTVGGGTIYVGMMAFDLSLNAQKELVFTVSLGRFDVKSHTVTIGGTTASEGGTVTVTNEAIVGMDVAVKATPNANWQFNGWSGTNVATGAKLVFVDARAYSTTFKMQAGAADVTATFALSEAYRAAQLTAVTNDAAATRNAIDTTETLSEAEKKALYAETDLTLDTATDALVKAVHPDAVKSAVQKAQWAFEDIRDAAEGRAEGKARFASSRVEGKEGEELKVVVYGGSKKGPSQVMVSLQKNTLTSFTAYYGTDAKGNPKKAKFPLALNWDAGDRSTRTIVFTTKVSAKIEPTKFLTLQLGSDAALRSVKPEICTVVFHDATDPTTEWIPYVRALAYPANGGKVSGYGTLKVKNGEVVSTRTLTATANKWATFKGWYRCCTNDYDAIDLENGFVTSERKLKVGKDSAFALCTYFAYFTDVTDVASVNLPDIDDAKGVVLDEGDYVGTVGVKFSLPVSFEDETYAGSMSVSGLPSGLKYDKKAGVITGVPTKACEKTVKCIAKNVAGKHTATFTFVIDEMPEMAIGTFNGAVSDDEAGQPHRTAIGSVTFTAGKTGSLSAKVTTRLSGARSFSVKGYDRIDDNTLSVYMVNRSGETFEATLSLTNGLYDTVLDGEVSGGKFEENDEEGSFLAVRNAFLRRDKNEEAQKVLSDYLGAYEETLYTTNGVDEVGTVTYTVKADGNVTVKAKIEATLTEKAKTLSGSLPGGFLYDAASKRAGCGGAIRSGAFLWSTEVIFDTLTDDVTGAARYIRDAGDTDQKVGK